MTEDTKKRIDTVPTPRASGVDAAITEPIGVSHVERAEVAAASNGGARATTNVRRGPVARGLDAVTAPAVEVPQQPSAPSPLVAGAPVAQPASVSRRPRVRTAVWIAVAAGSVVALASGSAVYAANSRDLEAQDAALAVKMRVGQSVVAGMRDAAFNQDADRAAATTALAASRARMSAQAQAVVDQANAVLAATPNAGDAPRAGLSAASSAVAAALVAPATSAASLRDLIDGVAAPQQVAVDGQAAWQTAENARIAAEQAAAAAAAEAQAQAAAAQAQAAAARAKAAAAPRASRSTATAPRAAAGAVAAPAAPPAPAAPSGIPAGGKSCTSAGDGAGESSVGAIGAAINAYRSGLGLPELSVSRSGGLVSHAIDMANAGGIWHSGSDNIVACVSSGSASAMVSAWSQSASHDAQMRRTDVSSMAVGGASLGGWLYGAVKFS